jgi:hypothetical protein
LKVFNSFCASLPLGIPLKFVIGFSHSPAAEIVRAAVILFVSLYVFLMWIVFVPCFARVLDLWWGKYSKV